MKKKTLNLPHKLEAALISLLDRLDLHFHKCIKQGQPLGACIIVPKNADIGPPSQEAREELERRATKHFQTTPASGYYLRYSTPPNFLLLENARPSGSPDDYLMTCELPQFDEEWQKTMLARELIFCPSEGEEGGNLDWFEVQLEAIRFTPLLHQTLEESKTIYMIQTNLNQAGLPAFEAFIYEYALHDPHFPSMDKYEVERWKKRAVDWKKRYHLIANIFPPSPSLRDIYITARKKAARSRNQMIKDMFWALVNKIEDTLILQTKLPAEVKAKQIALLRSAKQRLINKGKYSAKRPAICTSDVECAAVLYYLSTQFLGQKQKSIVLAEGILFIWIAQHAAFSKLHLKVDDILSIKIANIDFESLVIQVNNQEISPTQGLMDILIAWVNSSRTGKLDLLFQKLNYDNLEDLLSKSTTDLFGTGQKLLPRDFLEKVHVIPWTRITLDLRRQITQQEELVKTSPYRIKSQEIKKQIKAAIQEKSSHA